MHTRQSALQTTVEVNHNNIGIRQLWAQSLCEACLSEQLYWRKSEGVYYSGHLSAGNLRQVGHVHPAGLCIAISGLLNEYLVIQICFVALYCI